MLVVLARKGPLSAFSPEDLELLCEMDEWLSQNRYLCWDYIPGVRTARHSSADLWSGYDIVLDAGVELNKPLRNGNVGMKP